MLGKPGHCRLKMSRLVQFENAMVRWMCGVSLKNRRSMAELRERLGILDVLIMEFL